MKENTFSIFLFSIKYKIYLFAFFFLCDAILLAWSLKEFWRIRIKKKWLYKNKAIYKNQECKHKDKNCLIVTWIEIVTMVINVYTCIYIFNWNKRSIFSNNTVVIFCCSLPKLHVNASAWQGRSLVRTELFE